MEFPLDYNGKNFPEALKAAFPGEYTPPEIQYLWNVVGNAVRGVNDKCMDNFRASNGSKGSLAFYEERRRHGCCGALDKVVRLRSEKIFYFGFNFGH